MNEASSVQAAPGSELQRSPIDLATLLRVLLDRKWFVLSGSLGFATLLFCFSLTLKNTFKATALVLPPDQSSSSVSMLSAAAGVPAGALAALNMKTPGDLYVALMQSPVVEDAVIDRFQLQSKFKTTHRSLARRSLEGVTQILIDGKSGIISIAVVDTNPELAANLANGIVEAFDNLSGQLAVTGAARRRLFFERQLAKSKADLAQAENELKATSARTGILEPEGSARALISFEAQLRAQIAAKSVELQSLQMYDSDQNPEVQTAKRELQALLGQASALSQKSGGGDAGLSKVQQSSASLDYARALREVRYNEAVFELLLKNLEAAKLDEAREGNVVQVVSPATPPDLKDGPHRSFFLVGGFVLGFVFSVMWVVLGWARAKVAFDRTLAA